MGVGFGDLALGLRVSGLIYGYVFSVYCLVVYGLWFRVYSLGFMVYGLWFMVYGLWFRVYGLGFMVYGLGFGVSLREF